MLISQIEQKHNYDNGIRDDRGSLSSWYDSIRNRDVEELNIRDYAMMLRQNLYLEYALPIVMKILEEKPFVGEQFNGELLLSIKYIDVRNWQNDSRVLSDVVVMIDSILMSKKFEEYEEWLYDDELEETKQSFIDLRDKLKTMQE